MPQKPQYPGYCGFLLDNLFDIVYPGYMLTGIKIYSADSVWRQILTDFNATVVPTPDSATVNFDELVIPPSVDPIELKTIILNASDTGHILGRVLGRTVSLPWLQAQIVVLLYKSGGMTSNELKHALGYAPNTATHVIDTAIYQLRKLYGRDFIRNTDGVYSIGEI